MYLFQNFLGWFIQPAPTVDGVLASVKQAVTDLNQVVEAQDSLAAVQQSIMDAAMDARDKAISESDRAHRIAYRIEDLLS